MTIVNTIGFTDVTANFTSSRRLLPSAGFAELALSPLAFAGSAGLSIRSTLAASRSLATYSACALRVT